MRFGIKSPLLMGVVVVLLGTLGCHRPDGNPNGSVETRAVEGTEGGATPPAGDSAEVRPEEEEMAPNGEGGNGALPEEPTPPLTIPTVALDAASEATCLVKVGDVFPEGTLTDTSGNPVPLKTLLGEGLAVVYFWTGKNPYAVAGLTDLEKLVPKDLTDMGAVRVIAVNAGDAPEAVRELLAQTAAYVTNVFDTDGGLFEKVATEGLPRVYLIDSEGKIVWFDIEYSQSMKRDLRQALEVALSTKPVPQQASP